jgi:hypothetical protein
VDEAARILDLNFDEAKFFAKPVSLRQLTKTSAVTDGFQKCRSYPFDYYTTPKYLLKAPIFRKTLLSFSAYIGLAPVEIPLAVDQDRKNVTRSRSVVRI